MKAKTRVRKGGRSRRRASSDAHRVGEAVSEGEDGLERRVTISDVDSLQDPSETRERGSASEKQIRKKRWVANLVVDDFTVLSSKRDEGRVVGEVSTEREKNSRGSQFRASKGRERTRRLTETKQPTCRWDRSFRREHQLDRCRARYLQKR